MLLIVIAVKIISQLYTQQRTVMRKKSGQRRVGLIRTTPASSTQLPHAITDMTINNINIYKQMSVLDVTREDIFQRYEQIIRDLQNVIKNLEQKNEIINGERIQLLTQNVKLKEELESFRENYLMADSCVKEVVLFDIVPEDDQVFQPPKFTKRSNQILEQSELDLGFQGHFFSQQISAQLSVESLHSVSQQKTPCLNHHNSLIQCKSNNNQAPLRIFYLLILQEQNFIDKLRELLSLCYQDQSKVLSHLMPNGNQLWGGIIQKFFTSLLKGQFENQSEVVRYICENPILDILLVSLLKQSLPVQNEDQNLNLGNWKRQNINHRALFQGLCNQFDLKLEQDKQKFMFKFYVNMNNQKSLNVEDQQSNLLQSHISERNSVQQISLLPRGPNLISSNEQSRQQPLFKIWYDPDRQFYRAHVSIRPDNYNYNQDEQYQQSRSFNQTNKSQISESRQKYQIKQAHRQLLPRDLNRLNQDRSKYSNYQQDQYLRCIVESKNLSKNNSQCHSQYYENQ